MTLLIFFASFLLSGFLHIVWFFPQKTQQKSLFLFENRLLMAPQVGFEPTTLRLTAECYYR